MGAALKMAWWVFMRVSNVILAHAKKPPCGGLKTMGDRRFQI
jgi:hypothetical protein